MARLPHNEPCWCEGPFEDLDPADRPETTLGREHRLGDLGCDYADTAPSEGTFDWKAASRDGTPVNPR